MLVVARFYRRPCWTFPQSVATSRPRQTSLEVPAAAPPPSLWARARLPRPYRGPPSCTTPPYPLGRQRPPWMARHARVPAAAATAAARRKTAVPASTTATVRAGLQAKGARAVRAGVRGRHRRHRYPRHRRHCAPRPTADGSGAAVADLASVRVRSAGGEASPTQPAHAAAPDHTLTRGWRNDTRRAAAPPAGCHRSSLPQVTPGKHGGDPPAAHGRYCRRRYGLRSAKPSSFPGVQPAHAG